MRGSVVCKNVNEKKMSDKDDETENNLRLSISEVRQARKDLLYNVTKNLWSIDYLAIAKCSERYVLVVHTGRDITKFDFP